jgi:hypothetical protein
MVGIGSAMIDDDWSTDDYQQQGLAGMRQSYIESSQIESSHHAGLHACIGSNTGIASQLCLTIFFIEFIKLINLYLVMPWRLPLWAQDKWCPFCSR